MLVMFFLEKYVISKPENMKGLSHRPLLTITVPAVNTTLKSATNSHADYYCSLDTLFDDSLATSDVIIYE